MNMYIILIILIGILVYSIIELLVDLSIGFNLKIPGEKHKRFVDYCLETIEKMKE